MILQNSELLCFVRAFCKLLWVVPYAVKVNVECWKTMIPAFQSMPCLAAYAMTLMVCVNVAMSAFFIITHIC